MCIIGPYTFLAATGGWRASIKALPTPHHPPSPLQERGGGTRKGEEIYSAQGLLAVHALISNVARRWMLK